MPHASDPEVGTSQEGESRPRLAGSLGRVLHTAPTRSDLRKTSLDAVVSRGALRLGDFGVTASAADLSEPPFRKLDDLYLARLGDIGLTHTLVVTPSGTCARMRARWTADRVSADETATASGRRRSLVARLRSRRGDVPCWIDVAVQGGGISHRTRVAVGSNVEADRVIELVRAIEAACRADAERAAARITPEANDRRWPTP
jgi:hypothetical protein